MVKVFMVRLEVVNDYDHEHEFETFLFSNYTDAKSKFDELVETYSYLAIDGFDGDSSPYDNEDEMKEECLSDNYFSYDEDYSSIVISIDVKEVK